MARDLPEYERKQTIKPAAQSVGEVNAVGPSTTQAVLGELGRKMASEASLQYATQAGLDEGQTPGKKFLIPAITDQQKAFKEAYVTESSNILLSNFNSSINQADLDFHNLEFPNGDDLLQYRQSMDAIASDKLAMADPSKRGELQRLFKQKFEASFLKNAEKVNNTSRALQKEGAKQSIESNLKSMNDLAAAGHIQSAIDLKQSVDKDLDSDLYKTMFSPATIKDVKKLVQESFEDSLTRAETAEMSKTSGKVEEELRKLSEAPPTEANIRKAKVMYEANRQQNALRAAYEDKLIFEASTKRIQGKLTPVDVATLRDEVSELKFAKFEYDTVKWLQKANKDALNFDAIEMAKKDPGKLAMFSNDTKNAFIEYKADQVAQQKNIPNDLTHKLNVASAYKTTFPAIVKAANDTILSGDIKEATSVMRAYRAAQDKASVNYNPLTFAGLSKEAESMAIAYNNRGWAGNTPEEAFRKARENVTNQEPNALKAKDDRFKENTKLDANYDMSTLEKTRDQASKALGIKKSLMTDGLAMLYKDELQANNKFAENFEDAVELTSNIMQRAWGESKFNLETEATYAPFEKFVSPTQVGLRAARYQAFIEFEDFAKQSKEYFNQNSNADSYWELVQPNIAVKPGEYTYTGKDEIKIVRVYRSGEREKGILKINSDDRTLLTAAGVSYYWGAQRDDGYTYAIQDFNKNYAAKRFYPITWNEDEMSFVQILDAVKANNEQKKKKATELTRVSQEDQEEEEEDNG